MGAMNTQRNQTCGRVSVGLAVGLLLSLASAVPVIAADTTDADQVLLERAKVAKQIVVEGKPGTLQAEQEKAALDRAQAGYQNMDASRSAAAERRANFENAKAEAARIKEQREAKYWENSMNMEKLIARQQELDAERSRNQAAASQRDLKDWNVVGEQNEAGLAEQQRREAIRQENLKRYQESLQSGYAAVKTPDGMTVQAQVEAEQKAREQRLLQYNTGYWNQVMKNSEDGKALQERTIQANRENEIRNMQSRVKAWDSIETDKDAQLRDQAVRDQVRQANAQRFQQQTIEEYNASRVGG